MRFAETPLAGAWLLEPERHADERGYFARTYCAQEFKAHGLDPTVRQSNTSFNERAGTLRGMHYQADPHGETKLVRCTSGAIYDVIVDLRPDSPTHRGWFATQLSQDNGLALFVPVGFAHGFQTLMEGSEVLYQMGHDYVAEAARGVRYDDPAFEIDWPPPPAGGLTISERDLSYRPYER